MSATLFMQTDDRDLVIHFRQTLAGSSGYFNHINGDAEPPYGPEYEIASIRDASTGDVVNVNIDPADIYEDLHSEWNDHEQRHAEDRADYEREMLREHRGR